MVIVIDLSKQIVGYNLFESFFYKFINDGSLIFLNNYRNGNDIDVDYDELRLNVENILYDNHASSFSICVLYDMNSQIIDPIGNSIVSNVRKIKERVINPLLCDYSFNKLYYFSLDDVKRDYDGVPYNDNIKLAIDLDSLGYTKSDIDNKYSRVLFNQDEINYIDYYWKKLLYDNFYDKHDGINKDNIDNVMFDFKNELYLLFNTKTDYIRENFNEMDWYIEKLNRVYEMIICNFMDSLYKNIKSISLVDNPSVLFIDALKLEVSSYNDSDTVIIHIGMNDKYSSINREVLRYRHQLEIIGLIMYIATNDTRMVFESGQTISRENHFNIKVVLNEENVARMLRSYNSKLKIEIDKLNKYKNNDIECPEYAPRKFNLLECNNKPMILNVPKFKMFYSGNDNRKIDSFLDNLYKRYIKGLDYTNKRVRDLTIQLRVQKEYNFSGKVKKWNVLELSSMLNEMQDNINKLQQRIALYRPKDVVIYDPELKINYMNMCSEIEKLLSERVRFSTFVKNIILIVVVSLLSYPIIKEIGLSSKFSSILSLVMLVCPLVLYIIIQIIISNKLKKKINRKISLLVDENNRVVNNLFSVDNESSIYVSDIYNLIMQKKYVNDCNEKMRDSNKKFEQYNYHYDKLIEHYETSNKLIDILGVDNIDVMLLEIDKIHDVNCFKNVMHNEMYCPVNYLSLINDVKNRAIISDSKNIDIDSNLIGFIDSFIILYDKEYRNE